MVVGAEIECITSSNKYIQSCSRKKYGICDVVMMKGRYPTRIKYDVSHVLGNI